MLSRRKLASLVLLVGAVLVGGKLFDTWSHGPVSVEIHYQLGPAPKVTELDVVIGQAARFDTRLIQPDVVQHTRLPAGPQRLEATLVSASGERHTVFHDIEAVAGAVIRIDLSREASR